MKKLITVFSIILLFASCNQVKIAYVDVEEILKEYEGSKKAEEEMKAQSEKIATELDQLAFNFQQKVQEYQQNTNALSANAKKQKEQELMQEQQQIQQRQQMAQQLIQTEGQKRIDIINEDIESFLTDYAKQNGLTYILGTSKQTKSVMYGDKDLDITEEVIDALNDDYKSKSKEEKKEENTKE